MIIKHGNIRSKIVHATAAELDRLRKIIGSFEEGSLLEDGTYYAGITPFLQSCGFEIDPPPPSGGYITAVDDNIADGKVLRYYQSRSTTKTIANQRGIIQSATGSGKTLMSEAVIAHLQRDGAIGQTLVLVPTGYLMQQTSSRYREYGLDDVCSIGYGDRYRRGASVYVSTVDSAYKLINEESTDLENADLLILDEAHHTSAKMWRDVCEQVPAKWRLAYTATAFDDPDHYGYYDLILMGLTGPIIFDISSAELRKRGFLADPVVAFICPQSGNIPIYSWNPVYKNGIVLNKKRNSIICSIANGCYENGHKVLIFVGTKAHGHPLAETISQYMGSECIFVQGGSTTHQYFPSGSIQKHRWSVDDIGHYVNSRDRAIIITTTVLDEGLDIPIINVLIMGTGMKKYRRTLQRCGRGMRPKEGDNKVYIYDFWDDQHVFLLNQSRYRLATYKREQYIMSKMSKIQKMMNLSLDIRRDLCYKSKK